MSSCSVHSVEYGYVNRNRITDCLALNLKRKVKGIGLTIFQHENGLGPSVLDTNHDECVV